MKKAKQRRYLISFTYVGSPEIYQRSFMASSREMAEQKLKNMDWHKPIRIVRKNLIRRIKASNKKYLEKIRK